jgi:hypothetical protein
MLYKDWPVWRVWANICGIQTSDNNTPVPSYHSYEKIPSLLSDPCALMLKFILLAPLQLDQGMCPFDGHLLLKKKVRLLKHIISEFQFILRA